MNTVFVGKIEILPPCPGIDCLRCADKPDIDNAKKCARCPMCGPNGISCPIYQCGCSSGPISCTKEQMFDKNGCTICTPCEDDQSTCPVLNCVVPDCPGCSKLVSTKQPNGCLSCPVCKFSKPSNPKCPLPKCKDPGCASYISYLNKYGCITCNLKCQTSDECGIKECGECPSDCDL
jgi:hypothetical protein